MSRPRKPTNVLELSGAFKKNPKRGVERGSEPKPVKPVGTCPSHLSANHKKIWNEIKRRCAKGVLTEQDRFALEIVVVGLHGIRFGLDAYTSDGEEYTRAATSSEADRVFKQLGKFGLTPSERSNVVVPKQEKKEEGFDGGL